MIQGESLKVEITDDVGVFADRIDGMLRRDPLRHTVIATAVANRRSGLDTASEPSVFLSAHDDATTVGFAIKVAGREIFLGELQAASLDAVVEALVRVAPQAGGVEGVADVAAAFARRWTRISGVPSRLAFVNHLYRSGPLRFPDVPGSARCATDADLALCAEWLWAMHDESGIGPGGGNTAALRRRIATGRWWLWERDGRPVGLAAHQAPAHGWSRIGPVYTPPGERGNGYASILTAHVARIIGTEGLGACLFAAADNPTSNKIYCAIGFELVCDFAHYAFG